MPADAINGAFEGVGAILTFLNARRVYQDKGYAGINPPALAFFVSWGAWNLFYYPSLEQWMSFAGGLALVVANITWVVAMLYYGRISRAES
jgi:hypothetical protein